MYNVYQVLILAMVVTAQLRGPHICIYTTSKEFLKTLKNDPFGEKCIFRSKYVNDTCNEKISTHMCKNCGDKSLLPAICFCDKKHQCPDSYPGSPRGDEERKYDSSACLRAFNFTFHANIHISMFNNERQWDQTWINHPGVCKEGFTGPMCSSISKRLCAKTKLINQSLTSCNSSNDHKCYIVTNNGDKYECEDFNGVRKKRLRHHVECIRSINQRNSTSSTVKPSVNYAQTTSNTDVKVPSNSVSVQESSASTSQRQYHTCAIIVIGLLVCLVCTW